MPIITAQGRRILFIHVPKTGGSAIVRHFSECGQVSFERLSDPRLRLACIPRHWHGALLQEAFGAGSFDYAFMIVRHPAERTISDYRYYVKRKRRERRPPNFSWWLRYRLWRAGREPYYMDNHFRPQHEFECFGARVFRYEDGLDRCMAQVAADLGLAVKAALPKVNASPPIPVNLKDTDLALITNRYAADFERFGFRADI